jgi:hypothetical protein
VRSELRRQGNSTDLELRDPTADHEREESDQQRRVLAEDMEGFDSEILKASILHETRGTSGVAHLYVGLPSPPRTAAKAGVNTKGALSLGSVNQERRLGHTS